MTPCTLSAASISAKPVALDTIQLGDLCVLKVGDPRSDLTWRIGHVLQFAKYTGKGTDCTQEYAVYFAEVAAENVGVLCSWYNKVPGSESEFELSSTNSTKYIPISSYICSLTENCLEDDSDTKSESVLLVKCKSVTKRHFRLKKPVLPV